MFVLATNMDKHRNWKEYNDRLVKRGEITLYVEPAVLNQETELKVLNRRKIGRPYSYGTGLVFASFALKCFLRLAYRQTAGLVKDITKRVGLKRVPNFRTIWDRITAMKKEDIRFNITPLKPGEKVEIAIDSTGLKRVNDGEYRSIKYGKRKGWIKMHLSVNVKTGEALTEITTTEKIGDNSEFKKLTTPIGDSLFQIDADGAYDSNENFEWCQKKKVVCAIPVRINARRRCNGERRKAVIDQFHLRTGLESHAHVRYQKDTEKRRRRWQKKWKKKVGYGSRWMVEGAYGKFKGMFGEYLFSKKERMIQKELNTKLYIYNRTIIETF